MTSTIGALPTVAFTGPRIRPFRNLPVGACRRFEPLQVAHEEHENNLQASAQEHAQAVSQVDTPTTQPVKRTSPYSRDQLR